MKRYIRFGIDKHLLYTQNEKIFLGNTTALPIWILKIFPKKKLKDLSYPTK